MSIPTTAIESITSGATRAPTFAEVEETDQEWLWPGMIPAGLLTVVFGPPACSKTTFAVEYTARVSRGDLNPDGTSLGPAAPVLLGALEDISASSTKKKLRAAKADQSNVVDVSAGPDGDGLELELDHVAWLHEVAAGHPGTALITIDTLSSSATRPITTRPGLKAMLKPLAALAANTGAAVVLTAHSLKGHDDIPEGGRSLISIPRMVLTIQKSRDEPGIRTLSVYKSNISDDEGGEGFRYKLVKTDIAPVIEWSWGQRSHRPWSGCHRAGPDSAAARQLSRAAVVAADRGQDRDLPQRGVHAAEPHEDAGRGGTGRGARHLDHAPRDLQENGELKTADLQEPSQLFGNLEVSNG